MQSSKLVHTLAALSDSELGQAKKYVSVRVKNPSSPVLKLLRVLSQFHPQFDAPKLTTAYLFKKLYGPASFDQQKLKNTMTSLQRHLEAYLVEQELDQQPQVYQQLLAKAYLRRKCLNEAEQVAQKGLRETETEPLGLQRLQHRLAWQHELFFHYDQANRHTDEHALYDLTTAMNDLHALRLLLYALDRIARRQQKEDHTLLIGLNTALDYIRTEQETDEQLNYLANLYTCYSNPPDPRRFEQLKTQFTNNFEQWGAFERSMICKTLVNYLIPLASTYQQPYLGQLFELYQFGYQNGCLLTPWGISPLRFVNTVNAALMAQAFEWAESFIHEFAGQLNDERADTVRLCQAYWHYHKAWHTEDSAHYSQALDFLNQSEWTDLHHKLRQWSLRLRIAFDTCDDYPGEELDLIRQASNFARFLSRSEHKAQPALQRYQGFVQAYRQLVRWKSSQPAAEPAPADLEAAVPGLLFSPWFQRHLA